MGGCRKYNFTVEFVKTCESSTVRSSAICNPVIIYVECCDGCVYKVSVNIAFAGTFDNTCDSSTFAFNNAFNAVVVV